MKIKRKKDLTVDSIIESHKQYLRTRNGYVGLNARKIIKAYLHIVIATLANGYSFTIPSVATFTAYKKLKKAKSGISVYKPIVLTSEENENLSKMRFKAGYPVLDRLWNLMRYHNKDYQTDGHR